MADKHQRLDSQFSIVGAFWKPEATEVVLSGTLAGCPTSRRLCEKWACFAHSSARVHPHRPNLPLHKTKPHPASLSHIPHQRREKTRNTNSAFAPHAGIHNPSRASAQQSKTERLRGDVTVG